MSVLIRVGLFYLLVNVVVLPSAVPAFIATEQNLSEPVFA
jgi:hypothetical protein